MKIDKLIKHSFNFSLADETKLKNSFASIKYLTHGLINLGKNVPRPEFLLNYAENFYHYSLRKDYQEKIACLKSGLDKKSIREIDKMLKKQKYIFTNNILNIDTIFSKDEIKEQQKTNPNTYRRQYPGLAAHSAEVFINKNGLKFISSSGIDKLSGTVLIDGGAFVGDSAIIFSKEYFFKKIYAFEPDKNTFQLLLKNIKRFNLKNVKPVNNGLGLKNKGTGGFKIISIDKFLNTKKDGNPIGVIKMDIEGYEYEAILGAVKTIKKNFPLLLISIYHTAYDFFEIKPFIERMFPSKYTFRVRKINPFSPTTDIFLICIPK